MKPNGYQELVWDKLHPFFKAESGDDTFKQFQLVTLTLDINSSTGELASTLKNLILAGDTNTEAARGLLLGELEYLLAVVTCAAKFLGCPLERLMTTSADNFKGE